MGDGTAPHALAVFGPRHCDPKCRAGATFEPNATPIVQRALGSRSDQGRPARRDAFPDRPWAVAAAGAFRFRSLAACTSWSSDVLDVLGARRTHRVVAHPSVKAPRRARLPAAEEGEQPGGDLRGFGRPKDPGRAADRLKGEPADVGDRVTCADDAGRAPRARRRRRVAGQVLLQPEAPPHARTAQETNHVIRSGISRTPRWRQNRSDGTRWKRSGSIVCIGAVLGYARSKNSNGSQNSLKLLLTAAKPKSQHSTAPLRSGPGTFHAPSSHGIRSKS